MQNRAEILLIFNGMSSRRSRPYFLLVFQPAGQNFWIKHWMSMSVIRSKISPSTSVCFGVLFGRIADFLGRAEISVSSLTGSGPWKKVLILHGVDTGEIRVNIEIAHKEPLL